MGIYMHGVGACSRTWGVRVCSRAGGSCTVPRSLGAPAEANPGMREMLQNPETLARMSDPETLRNNLRMMQQMRGAGIGAPGMGGFGAAPPGPATPPEEMYASQLAQMKDMGFFDEAQNIRVLQQCMGNVSAAIERLLAGP